MRYLAMSCLLWMGTAELSSARIVYVNNTIGDDRFTGKSPDTLIAGQGPIRSIQRALQVAQFGDHIMIANTGEPYRECVTCEGPRNSGSPIQPFVVEGNGAVLDGTASIPPAAWEPASGNVLAFRPPRISFQRLFRDGQPLPPREVNGPNSLSLLEPLQWSMVRQAIHFRPEPAAVPGDYDLAFSRHPIGITLYKVRHVIIRDLVIQGYRLDGLNAHDNAFDCRIQRLTSRHNGRAGVSIGGASRVRLSDCQLLENGVSSLRTEGWCHVSVEQSNLDRQVDMQGGRVLIDGVAQRRSRGAHVADSAPLHRP